MTGVQLATMSTALWVVATVALFILLAGWSTGTSWGLTASLVHGVRGWAGRAARPMPIVSPGAEALRPILDPYAFVRRDGAPTSTEARTAADSAHAEIVELWERHLPG